MSSFAWLAGFLALIRLGLGLLTLRFAYLAWTTPAHERDVVHDHGHRSFLLAGLLLVLDVASWPVFYWLLQSSVAEVPGVMCIYGVTQIGAGSHGASSLLPPLVKTLELAKPPLLFLSGAWVTLHCLNRASLTAPLTRRVLAVLALATFLGGVGTLAELAYLAIPRPVDGTAGGCCTEAFDGEARLARFVPTALFGQAAGPWLWGGFVSLNVLLVAFLARGQSRPAGVAGLMSLLILSGVTVGTSAAFFGEIAVPRLIRLPHHHCPYDLVTRSPETLVAVGLYLTGMFAVGWACVAAWLGRHPETEEARCRVVTRLLGLGAGGLAAALVMISVELALTL